MSLIDIASEHIIWCATKGFKPQEVLESINMSSPGHRDATWEDVHMALVARHRQAMELLALRHRMREAA